MPENKKDSFTFSDKIKNSKPAFNPFSKRASSKIGSNGKPKKTLFERTKRDAPFFVAAAAALLMLPFLYKYSGSMNEEPIIPPGSEDTVFDPERFGYEPSVEDPNGQIAQLTGRDPFSLIKGWGSDDETEDEALPPYEDFSSRDGLEDTYTPPVSNDYRQSVPPATRAAFQRQATKINELGSASMTRASGGGAGFDRFGGANLKAAAKEDSSGGPRQGTKPVSLQPLRAADSPSRSYFGQGGAAQARASRDALSKANAAQALRDAMFNPVETGRIGGIGTGEFAPGGGAGKVEHVIDYKGMTPWWWDMMKDRAQKKWEWKYFLWRKNLVEPLIKGLAEVLVDFGKGLACCILTGEDDCSMGSMWGVSAESYSPGGCKINKKTYTTLEEVKEAYPGAPIAGDLKKWCQSMAKNKNQTYGDVEWVAESGGGGNLGFFGKRAYCLGNTFGARGSRFGNAELKDRFNCEAVDTTRNFELQAGGKAGKWKQYHAVIAKNYVPFDNNGSHYLCGIGNKNPNKQSVAAGDNANGGMDDVRARNATKNERGRYAGDNYDDLQRNDVNDSCVIYVAEGGVFDWMDFKAKTMNMLAGLNLKKDGQDVNPEDAFGALHLYFIEGYAMKSPLSKGKNVSFNADYNQVKVKNMPVDVLPITYADFETYYILRKGNLSKDTEKFSDKKRNFASPVTGVDGSSRTAMANDGKENAIRTACSFSNFRITALAIDSPENIVATLTFDPEVHGKTAGNIQVTLDIPEAGITGVVVKHNGNVQDAGGQSMATYEFKPSSDSQRQALSKAAEMGGITAKWKASFGDKLSMDSEEYVGEYVVEQVEPTQTQCQPGQTETSADGDQCEIKRTCQNDGTWGSWAKTDPNCPQGKTEPVIETVSFFNRVPFIPLDDIELMDLNVRLMPLPTPTKPAFGRCELLANVENKQLVTIDNDVRNLLKQAQQKYNAANKDKNNNLQYSENSITVANLLDAMTIMKGDIPMNAVCALGKTIGANAKDGANGNNMFGAFAAYMGPDSSFFPTLYKKENGKSVVDSRFYGCNSGKEVNNNKQYHYGHYNWNYQKLGDQAPVQNDRQPFEAELAQGPWKEFPLKAIADAVGFQRASTWNSSVMGQLSTNMTLDSYNRNQYHKAYEDIFQPSGSCGLDGKTMKFEDVQAYITALCTYGVDNIKPSNGNKLECNRRFKADSFASGW